jgi:hypothetical protein
MPGESERLENMWAVVTDSLHDLEMEVLHELKVRVAGSEPMDWVPPGMDEVAWKKLRVTVGDSIMRRRIWSVLADLEAWRAKQ